MKSRIAKWRGAALLPLLGWSASLALAMAGCGGKVVWEGPGAGGAPSTGPGLGGSTDVTTTTTVGITTSTIATTTSTTVATTTTTSGPCAMTCAEAIENGNLKPCGASAAAKYQSLVDCACGTLAPCGTQCTANICIFAPVSGPCEVCLEAKCPNELQACKSN